MMTGLHRVCDVHCKGCMKTIGWTYVIHFNIIIDRFMHTKKAKSIRKANILLKERISKSNQQKTNEY